MNAGAADTWFVAGTVPFIVFGALHAAYALFDMVRPTYFAPVDRSVKPALEATGVRIARPLRHGANRPSMWGVWLGINVAFGLALASFGLLCLLIATHDFELVKQIDALRPLTIAFSATYFVVALRFWFWAPMIISGVATVCFAVAAVLSA